VRRQRRCKPQRLLPPSFQHPFCWQFTWRVLQLERQAPLIATGPFEQAAMHALFRSAHRIGAAFADCMNIPTTAAP
jgi:hypothetical protein